MMSNTLTAERTSDKDNRRFALVAIAVYVCAKHGEEECDICPAKTVLEGYNYQNHFLDVNECEIKDCMIFRMLGLHELHFEALREPVDRQDHPKKSQDLSKFTVEEIYKKPIHMLKHKAQDWEPSIGLGKEQKGEVKPVQASKRMRKRRGL